MSIKTTMTELADAVRSASGLTRKLNVDEMADAIQVPEFVDDSILDGSAVDIHVPGRTKRIRDYAFWGFDEINVYIPSTVTQISTAAFQSGATVYCAFPEGKVSGAPWGAGNVIYDSGEV